MHEVGSLKGSQRAWVLLCVQPSSAVLAALAVAAGKAGKGGEGSGGSGGREKQGRGKGERRRQTTTSAKKKQR